MALKSVYKATRGDRKRLVEDVRPGDILYVVHDVADRYVTGKGAYGYEDAQLYSVHIVTADRSWPSGHLTTCSPHSTSVRGTESIVQLLAREREVFTEEPVGIRNISSNPRAAVDAQKLAAKIARLHAEEVAADRAKKATKGSVGDGTKRGWF
ncbi:hypothetical protein ABZX98_19250 [Streptomyces sp. NPDC002992]|uniref:hypothetical protein n=1 Tax=Streptomyces sp. NPDC002992 TaxID=3154273 RepID=UPI0033A8EDBF